MKEIKCPKCGEIFQVDESGYAAIVKQVHDKEFDKELKRREEQFRAEKDAAIELAVVKANSVKDSEIAELRQKLSESESEKTQQISKLQLELELEKKNSETAVEQAVQRKETEIIKLQSDLKLEESKHQSETQSLKEKHAEALKSKDEQISYYKDFKTRLSTKMVGETLEQHCEIEFNRLRATAFQKAYFEKDNDAKTGSKGDYIYREASDDGVEFISIMFEMKNEMEETATKHKNEDFFKELDKDRKEKGCEYAVLVTLLEADNELYNSGIVDVSYKYDKMYVIRPQFFIPLITILRNAALNSLSYKRELALVRNQNIDITNFESSMDAFKKDFARNVRLADERFQTAIKEIDNTIEHLQKTKAALLASDHNLQIANRKADELNIKRLTKDNPTMQKMFEDLDSNKEE